MFGVRNTQTCPPKTSSGATYDNAFFKYTYYRMHNEKLGKVTKFGDQQMCSIRKNIRGSIWPPPDWNWHRVNPCLTGSQPNAIDRVCVWGGGGAYDAPRLTPKPMTAARRARRHLKGLAVTVLKRTEFFLKSSRLKWKSGQSSKLSVFAFWFSEPSAQLKQVQTRPKYSQMLD